MSLRNITINSNLPVTGNPQKPYRFMIAALSLLHNFSFGLNCFVVAPVLAGALADTFGTYIPGFALFAALAFSIVIAGFAIPENRATIRASQIYMSIIESCSFSHRGPVTAATSNIPSSRSRSH